jgi:outer membrane lipoprotein-sorting protein
MAGMRQAIWIAIVLSGWLAAATVRADTVPLPTPAPAPKERSAPAAPSTPSGTTSSSTNPSANQAAPGGPSISTFLDSLNSLNPFSGKSNHPTTDPSTFDAKQRALVNRVSAYLTSVQVLTGNFVQIGPDGRRTTGHLFIQKPGKVRFEYDPPSPIDIIADGTQVVVRDRQLATQDLYPLSQTPLRFLLADHIDLLQDTNVVGVTADDTYVSVLIEEKQTFVGTNRLLMMFDSKDFKLKQWTVTDVQGFDTTIAVSNLDTSKRPDPNLFKFDYTRYVQ